LYRTGWVPLIPTADFRLLGEVRLARLAVLPVIPVLRWPPPGAGLLGGAGEPAQRRIAQQAAGERAHPVRADPEHDPRVRQHLRGQQRVPAEGEEVVVEPDPLPPQQPGP